MKKILITTILIMIMVTGAGCGTFGSMDSGYIETTETQEEYNNYSSEEESYSDSDGEEYVDPSLMPQKQFDPEEMVGTWVNYSDPDQPRIVEIIDCGDEYEFQYDYYKVLLGNGEGLNLRNETTKFEFNSGRALIYNYDGRIDLYGSNDGVVYQQLLYIDDNTLSMNCEEFTRME